MDKQQPALDTELTKMMLRCISAIQQEVLPKATEQVHRQAMRNLPLNQGFWKSGYT